MKITGGSNECPNGKCLTKIPKIDKTGIFVCKYYEDTSDQDMPFDQIGKKLYHYLWIVGIFSPNNKTSSSGIHLSSTYSTERVEIKKIPDINIILKKISDEKKTLKAYLSGDNNDGGVDQNDKPIHVKLLERSTVISEEHAKTMLSASDFIYFDRIDKDNCFFAELNDKNIEFDLYNLISDNEKINKGINFDKTGNLIIEPAELHNFTLAEKLSISKINETELKNVEYNEDNKDNKDNNRLIQSVNNFIKIYLSINKEVVDDATLNKDLTNALKSTIIHYFMQHIKKAIQVYDENILQVKGYKQKENDTIADIQKMPEENKKYIKKHIEEQFNVKDSRILTKQVKTDIVHRIIERIIKEDSNQLDTFVEKIHQEFKELKFGYYKDAEFKLIHYTKNEYDTFSSSKIEIKSYGKQYKDLIPVGTIKLKNEILNNSNMNAVSYKTAAGFDVKDNVESADYLVFITPAGNLSIFGTYLYLKPGLKNLISLRTTTLACRYYIGNDKKIHQEIVKPLFNYDYSNFKFKQITTKGGMGWGDEGNEVFQPNSDNEYDYDNHKDNLKYNHTTYHKKGIIPNSDDYKYLIETKSLHNKDLTVDGKTYMYDGKTFFVDGNEYKDEIVGIPSIVGTNNDEQEQPPKLVVDDEPEVNDKVNDKTELVNEKTELVNDKPEKVKKGEKKSYLPQMPKMTMPSINMPSINMPSINMSSMFKKTPKESDKEPEPDFSTEFTATANDGFDANSGGGRRTRRKNKRSSKYSKRRR
jgi:hypothetical protein